MKELDFLIERVKAKLDAENVSHDDTDACIKALSRCVAPNICIKIYNEHINN